MGYVLLMMNIRKAQTKTERHGAEPGEARFSSAASGSCSERVATGALGISSRRDFLLRGGGACSRTFLCRCCPWRLLAVSLVLWLTRQEESARWALLAVIVRWVLPLLVDTLRRLLPGEIGVDVIAILESEARCFCGSIWRALSSS
jgi:hypothetical protein